MSTQKSRFGVWALLCVGATWGARADVLDYTDRHIIRHDGVAASTAYPRAEKLPKEAIRLGNVEIQIKSLFDSERSSTDRIAIKTALVNPAPLPKVETAKSSSVRASTEANGIRAKLLYLTSNRQLAKKDETFFKRAAFAGAEVWGPSDLLSYLRGLGPQNDDRFQVHAWLPCDDGCEGWVRVVSDLSESGE